MPLCIAHPIWRRPLLPPRQTRRRSLSVRVSRKVLIHAPGGENPSVQNCTVRFSDIRHISVSTIARGCALGETRES